MRLALVRHNRCIRRLMQAPGVGKKKRKQYYRADDSSDGFNSQWLLSTRNMQSQL